MDQKASILNMLKKSGTMTQGALAEAIYGDKNHASYVYNALMGLVDSGKVLKSGNNPAYYSISEELKDIWPSEDVYPVNLTKYDWKRFLNEVEISHMGCMRVLACYVDIGGVASPKVMASRYQGHPNVYTTSIQQTCRRAIDYFNMEPCPDVDTVRYFPVGFQGHITKTGEAPGTYEYLMRPELLDALREMDLSDIDLIYNGGDAMTDKLNDSTKDFDKNVILYGPPGTGKTYNTVIYAVAICDGLSLEEVKRRPYKDVLERYAVLKNKEKRVAFTTFHQSFGYEEFIEGIKPRLDSDSSDIEYTINDGVFKAFCDRASTGTVNTSGTMIKDNAQVWGIILGGNWGPDLKQRCFDDGVIRIGWPDSPEVIDEDTEGLSDKSKRMLLYFQDEMEIGDLVVVRETGETIDAIGVVTGDYEFDISDTDFPRKRTVKWLITNESINILTLNGGFIFDRKTIYPLSRINVGELLNKINVRDEYVANTKPYVFIIDEINRGNISKIFGELITLIETTKRKGAKEAMEAILPYSNVPFSVPDNVYIIGTMNTADRSIALMDTALRRRFSFVEMMPDTEVLDSLGAGIIEVDGEELNVAMMLDVINRRIEYLYDREHTIGHAFFTKLADNPSIDTLAEIFSKNVIPLLQEYFYEDYEKIQLVLGDNGKADEFKFILDRPVKAKDIFNGNPDVDLPEKSYVIQKEAFLKLQSYKLISKVLQDE